MTEINERLETVDEVAARLNVHRSTIYRWIDERGLPVQRVGRVVRFKPDEVNAWWAREAVASGVAP